MIGISPISTTWDEPNEFDSATRPPRHFPTRATGAAVTLCTQYFAFRIGYDPGEPFFLELACQAALVDQVVRSALAAFLIVRE